MEKKLSFTLFTNGKNTGTYNAYAIPQIGDTIRLIDESAEPLLVTDVVHAVSRSYHIIGVHTVRGGKPLQY